VIRLFNSLSQRKEDLAPRDPGKVGVYACGPTVYNLIHVGNARPYVVFAVLRSWLRFRGYEVTLVENITDVDDKIINKAKAEGRSPSDVAREFTEAYLQDTDRLGLPRPDLEPRATETIPEIIDLCGQLVAAGHAYEAQGSVYFRVRSFPAYGRLSRQRVEELEEGARVESEPGKEDPLDFAVWKAAKLGEPSWTSPWGEGRPGWHIECSAMGLRYLGTGFDIHGGGRDLIFPHHENEIAQAEAAGLPFARVWMHNGMLRTEGEKMAKSVGNITLLRETLDRYPAPVVMTYFLTTHYRSPLEFSVEKLDEASASYQRLTGAMRDVAFRLATADRARGRGDVARLREALARARAEFDEYMDDDLNTAGAVGALFALVGDVYRHLSAVDEGREPLDVASLSEARQFLEERLGVLLVSLPADLAGDAAAPIEGAARAQSEKAAEGAGGEAAAPQARDLAAEGAWDEIEGLYRDALSRGDATFAAALRDHERAMKNWSRADGLRDEIQAAGFAVRDTPQGTQVVPRR
jgi:cysteinyl-tRNA synthetase